MRSTCTLVLWLILVSQLLYGQNALPIGHWRTHLPYRAGSFVTQSDSRVYYSSRSSVLILDKEEDALEFLTKVDGLSNVGIERIKYNRFSDILVIVYDNGAIDLVKPQGISTMNQIKNFDNFVGDKEILDIFVENDSIIYLAANYGLSKIDLFAEEFVFSTLTGIPVQGVTIHKNRIFLATAEGIYAVDKDFPNPEIFGAWQWLGPEDGFPPDYSSRTLVNYQDQLYADVHNQLVRVEEGGLTALLSEPGYRIEYLTAEGTHLLAGLRCTGNCPTSNKFYYVDPQGRAAQASNDCMGDPRYAIEDESGRIWFADGFRNFRSFSNLEDEGCNFRDFNSPWSDEVSEVIVQDGQVWLASGGVTVRFGYRFLDHGFASFIDGQWTIYNRQTERALRGEDPNDPNDDLLDFISVAVNPQNGKAYGASYFEGLAEVDGEEVTFYNEKNSSLGNAVGDGLRTRVSGLTFDDGGNLWIANYLAVRPLSVLTAGGEWQSFDLSCNHTEIHQLDVDQNGYKWIVVANNQAGVLLFDEGELENAADNRCRTFTAANSELPTNNVNTLAVDLDGDVWVGTSEGVVIFECGSNAFDPNCVGSRRIVEQDGFNAYLLATENVQTIAVDGANRKWVGTQNGLFVLSPSGNEQIAHFTAEDSPLLSNNVIDIGVDLQSGEVFIGTDLGLISYQSDAVGGASVNSSTITVFPNPVRPEYDGPIAIRGLARDANVKITDVNGKLIYETTALGGQAVWDGRDYTGRRVNSGVYLVFSTSNPGNALFVGKPDAAIARIVLIN